MKIRVGILGNRFTLNGEPVVLRTVSSFSTMAYLDRWARGLGGKWENMVDRYFERVTQQGLHGVRVFGETTDWARRGGDDRHAVFNESRATSARMWNYGQLEAGIRPTALTAHNEQIIKKLVEKLQNHGLIAEYVTDATLKHTPRVGWSVISHCIRQTASFLQSLQNELGDINLFHELHNEWDANSGTSWARDNIGYEEALAEVNSQFVRHRRLSGGEPEQWPRGIVGVSHGGRDTVDYRVGRPDGSDYVALHPIRRGRWWAKTNLENRYRDRVRYYNESKNYTSPAEWVEFIEGGAYSPTSSTQDLARYLEFTDGTLANGIAVCYHSHVGICSGFFEEEEQPLSPLEQELIRRAEEPVPPVTFKFGPIIELAYQEILERKADENGLRAYNERMIQGLAEAGLREDLLRSAEFRDKNPLSARARMSTRKK